MWDLNRFLVIITLSTYLFFLPLRTTDDGSTTQRKVAQMLETVDKVKWKPAENVEEDEEKVCWERDV